MVTEAEMNQLLIKRHGAEVFKRVKVAHVAIAGLGGLGSHTAVMLARAGVGSLHLLDFDRVDPSNLNRQAYKLKDVGRYKTEALSEEIHEINPYIKVTTDTVRVTEVNAKELFAGERLICEAFDDPRNKAMLVETLLSQMPEAILVAGSGMAGYGSANQIQTRRRFERLYVCGDEVSDIQDGTGLMAPRVTLCAAHQANMILRLILGESAP